MKGSKRIPSSYGLIPDTEETVGDKYLGENSTIAFQGEQRAHFQHEPGRETEQDRSSRSKGNNVRVSSMSPVEKLNRTGYHPVLLFGASRSGKSSLIMSIIRTFQTTPDVNVRLGEPVLDLADPRCKEVHAQAQQYFERGAYIYDQGNALDATRGEFFIPVDIEPAGLPSVKLAFLDGRGEYYVPTEDVNAEFYKPMHKEISDLLQRFSYGISVIFVAPYWIEAAEGDKGIREANFGLLGALKQYGELRQTRENDFLLFLLAKWDEFASPMHRGKLFYEVVPADVDRELRKRYAQSWSEFQAIQFQGTRKGRRAFMQYSSGYFIDGQPTPPPENFAAWFERYPRTLINWLYSNALQAQANEHGPVARRNLFKDVVSERPGGDPLAAWLLSVLTSR